MSRRSSTGDTATPAGDSCRTAGRPLRTALAISARPNGDPPRAQELAVTGDLGPVNGACRAIFDVYDHAPVEVGVKVNRPS